MYCARKTLAVAAACLLAAGGQAGAATITAWNTTNVDVAPTPADGVTAYSVVYDRDATDPAAVTNGRIAFEPPEAFSPGIKVEQEEYTQGGGPGALTLDGCLMTSSNAVCTSPFQSGKRIKQQMTGFGPVDLVFDVDPGGEGTSYYQVFHRLINVTGQKLTGFNIELGFGIGDGFNLAGDSDGIAFASGFRAPGSGGAPANSQFPFGLFGDATDNPNFSLDGFFAPERTGLNVAFGSNTLTSDGYYGPYASLFGNWLSQDGVPEGGFWDNDNNEDTDALLMAWLRPDGQWEARREVLDLLGGTAGTLTEVILANSFDGIAGALGLGGVLIQDVIEDLANLNVNFAIALSEGFSSEQFTMRVQVAPVPLPAAAPLLVVAFGLMAFVRRRQLAAA